LAFITVSKAAEILDVSERRVRNLLERGALGGDKVAGRWLVEPESVHSYGYRRSIAGGRYPSARIAWGMLLTDFGRDISSETDEALGLGNDGRRLIRSLAIARPIEDWRWLCTNRARTTHFATRDAFVERLATTAGLVAGGLSAAERSGIVSGRRGIDAYASAEIVSEVSERFLLTRSSESSSNVTLRVVTLGDAADRYVLGRSVMPPAVVAVDLIEQRDERTRRVGLQMLSELGIQG
jgi:hypothetical protein